jgi:hypothetical protein
MRNLKLASSMLVSPAEAFHELDKAPTFWFPLLVPIVAQAAVFAWYYGVVDYQWLSDQLISGTPELRDLPPEQQQKAMLSHSAMMWLTISLGAVFFSLLRVAEAGYFWLAGRMADVQRSFRHWLALSAWSTFPYLLAIVVMTIPLLLQQGGKTTQEGLNLLSLNELLLGVPRDNRWHTLASTLTVLHPWLWWLGVQGVRVWSGRSLGFSMALALAPVVLIYGAWALFILI